MPKKFNEIVGTNVLFFRKERDLTHRQLEALSGVDKETICKIEKCRDGSRYSKRIDHFYIEQLAAALEVTAESIMETNTELDATIQMLNSAVFEVPARSEVIAAADDLILKVAKYGPTRRGYAYLYRGLIDYNNGMYSSSSEYFETAYTYAQRSHDKTLLYRTMRNLASAWIMLGLYGKAEQLVHQVMYLSKDKIKLPEDLFRLASIRKAQYKNQEAMELFKESSELSSDSNIANLTRCKQALSSLCRDLGMHNDALTYAYELVSLAKSTKYELALIYAYRNLGEIYKDLGEFEKSSLYFSLGLDVSKKIGRTHEEYYFNFEIGLFQGDYDTIKEIAIAFEKIDSPPHYVSNIYEIVAEKAFEGGFVDDFRFFILKANEMLKKR